MPPGWHCQSAPVRDRKRTVPHQSHTSVSGAEDVGLGALDRAAPVQCAAGASRRAARCRLHLIEYSRL